MSQELTAHNAPLPALSIRQTWLTALIRPSVSGYAALGQQPQASAGRACMWLFAAGLIAGAINALVPFITQLLQQSAVDLLLLGFTAVSALIVVVYVAVFAGCAQALARLFKGSGRYGQLIYVFATFSAPLLIIASLLDLLPQTRGLDLLLYIYWLVLYGIAIRAVNGLSRLKTLLVLLPALLVLGCAGLGGLYLLGSSGLLLP